MEPATPVVLEYSAPTEGERRWGPVLFRPSWVTVLLFLLTCGTFAWLIVRHQPWRLVATLPCDYQDSPHLGHGLHATFTPDGLLLFDTTHGACLYEPTTGHHLRTLFDTIDRNRFRYYAFTESRHILSVPLNQRGRPVAASALFDWSADRITASDPGLDAREDVVGVSPSLPVVVVRLNGNYHHIAFRDLTRSPSETSHSHGGHDAIIAPDGRTAIVIGIDGAAAYGIIDLKTGRMLGSAIDVPRIFSAPALGFGGADHLWIGGPDDRPGTATYHIVTRTGAQARLVLPSAGTTGADVALSDDGRLFASIKPWNTLEVRDTRTGNLLLSRPTQLVMRPLFFPGSHRLLTGDSHARRHIIIHPDHGQPLAILPSPPSFRFWPTSVISPDGETIVVAAGNAPTTVAVYRRTGWDCPESHLGAFAFPHVWLLSVLLGATIFVATRDARRARVDTPSIPPRFLANALILLSLLPTLHFLLCGALGRWTLNPAPLILLAAIGLLTHSRFWRFACLITLAVTLGWSLYLLNTLRPAGIAGSTSWLVLDREYLIPRLLPSIGLAFTVLLCIAALFLLVRRRQMVTHGA